MMRHFDRVALLVALTAMIGTSASRAEGQMRPDQPRTLDPPPIQPPAAVPDFAAEFGVRYAAAGSPRIALFWNAELSDRARGDLVLTDRVTSAGSASNKTLRQETGGSVGSATLDEGTSQSQSQRQREVSVSEREDVKRATTLSSRNAAQLERAFDSQLHKGGMRLVDRAMAMRATSTESDKSIDTQKRLEGEALRGKADLLLQVLLVADDKAPIGYGFDVSVRDVTTGEVLSSFYTIAVPPPRPVVSRYVAGDHGFELQSTVVGKIGIEDVAVALANEVMQRLGPALHPKSRGSRAKSRPK